MSFPSVRNYGSLSILRLCFRTTVLAAASMVIFGCVFGGTGTDTENGAAENKTRADLTGISASVVDGNGHPIAGVSFKLYHPEFRPDAGVAQATLVADAAKTLVSDKEGFVALPLKASGKLVVEGVSAAGQTLFYDTLAVPDAKANTHFTFRARELKGFKGRVSLLSGMRIDSGSVFIRGTGRFVKVDAAGNYDLGSLPADVVRMAIGMRFSSSPTSVKEVTLVNKPDTMGPISTDTSKTTYQCKDVPTDSAARITAPAQRDPASVDSGKSVPTSAVDTGKVNTALQSCDTLEQGGVINVVPPDQKAGTSVGDTAGTPVIVLQNARPISMVTGYKGMSDPVVVPYGECIIGAGQESTTFDLQLQPTGANSDILIQDVADKCLIK